MQTLALTGATGFVGGHVMAELAKTTLRVNVLARDPSRIIAREGIHVVKGSLADAKALDDLCTGADTVLHLAGAVSATDVRDFHRINVLGTAGVVASARKAGIKRFVHVSSLAAREPGLSPYAASKCASEKLVLESGLNAVVLRPAAIFGEGDTATLPLIKALFSSVAVVPGTRDGLFSIIHAADFARICIAALQSEITGIKTVADGHAYTWRDVVSATRKSYGTPRILIHAPRPLAMAIGAGGDLLSRLTGRPQMVSSAKMRELYHSDWSTTESWPGITCRPLAEALGQTARWYASKGLLKLREHVVRHGS